MKVGFTSDEVINLYHGLANDVWTDLGLDIPLPGIVVGEFADFANFAYAAANFTPERFLTDLSSVMTDFMFGEASLQAHSIEVNSGYLDYLYEDEVIGVILHELAHAIMGPTDSHSREWSDLARSIGGHYHETMVMRNYKDYHRDTGIPMSGAIPRPWYEVYA